MQNSNLDETFPTPVKKTPQDPPGDPNVDETRANPASRESDKAEASLEETRATPTGQTYREATGLGDASPPFSGPTPKMGGRRRSWPVLTVLGLCALFLIAAMSAFGGYQSGISLRTGAEATQVISQIQEQFALGEQDLADGQYDRARQRFEYIIQLDPGYPGVTEKLAQTLLRLNSTATPTPAVTPTLTPTPDLRSAEERYSQAQQSLANNDWTAAIDTLLELRKDEPDLHPIEVDGMLFIALRNRGVDKIVKEADLEGGIYNLTLAGRFGPVDTEAKSFLNWARLYITGASFWEIDWKQALDYFSQVAPALPNLRDGSGLTAAERYRLALIGYGDTLMREEQWCEAQAQYELGFSMGADPEVEEALAEAIRNCTGISDEEPPAEEEVPPPPEATPTLEEILPTPTVEGEVPVEPTPYPAP